MKEIKNKIKTAFNYAERLDYHPEGNTGQHIFLVCVRALLYTNDVNLVLAGIFHDICKPDSGYSRVDTLGNTYWSNPDHDQQAGQYLNDSWNAYKLIRSMNGNVNQIKGLCRWHMAMKSHMLKGDGLNKNAKLISGLETFAKLDDMKNRVTPKQSSHPIYIPDWGRFKSYRIDYIGVSPLQVENNINEFTVTINRTPINFGYDRVYEFFEMNPKFKDLSELFKI